MEPLSLPNINIHVSVIVFVLHHSFWSQQLNFFFIFELCVCVCVYFYVNNIFKITL
jgi:hypothetical protein